MGSDLYVLGAPSPGEVGRQITADASVQFQQQILGEDEIVEVAVIDRLLHAFDAPREMGCELGVAQYAKLGLQVPGCRVRRASSCSSIR